MNPVTKNDLNVVAQQIMNTVISKTVSYQDVQNIVQGSAQRMCSKQDVITMLNGMRDLFLDRMAASVREQQNSTRILVAQIDSLQHKVAQLESKLDANRVSIQAVQSTVEHTPAYNPEAPERIEPTFQRYFDK